MDWPGAIRRHRIRNGIKQEALAAMLKCDQSAVSHWERGIDNPSLAFQRQLLVMLANDQRALEDIRLFTAVEHSPTMQCLMDKELRIIAGSTSYWGYMSFVENKDPNVFRDLGLEANKELARKTFKAIERMIVLDIKITGQPKGKNTATRMRATVSPISLSDGEVILRVDMQEVNGNVDAPIETKFIDIDDFETG